MNGHVDFEQAKTLHALGFRGEWPQLVWADRPYRGMVAEVWDGICAEVTEWYPAPDYLTALQFVSGLLKVEVNVVINGTSPDGTWQDGDCWVDGPFGIVCRTPSELLTAVLAKATEAGDGLD